MSKPKNEGSGNYNCIFSLVAVAVMITSIVISSVALARVKALNDTWSSSQKSDIIFPGNQKDLMVHLSDEISKDTPTSVFPDSQDKDLGSIYFGDTNNAVQSASLGIVKTSDGTNSFDVWVYPNVNKQLSPIEIFALESGVPLSEIGLPSTWSSATCPRVPALRIIPTTDGCPMNTVGVNNAQPKCNLDASGSVCLSGEIKMSGTVTVNNDTLCTSSQLDEFEIVIEEMNNTITELKGSVDPRVYSLRTKITGFLNDVFVDVIATKTHRTCAINIPLIEGRASHGTSGKYITTYDPVVPESCRLDAEMYFTAVVKTNETVFVVGTIIISESGHIRIYPGIGSEGLWKQDQYKAIMQTSLSWIV